VDHQSEGCGIRSSRGLIFYLFIYLLNLQFVTNSKANFTNFNLKILLHTSFSFHLHQISSVLHSFLIRKMASKTWERHYICKWVREKKCIKWYCSADSDYWVTIVKWSLLFSKLKLSYYLFSSSLTLIPTLSLAWLESNPSLQQYVTCIFTRFLIAL
jgi:hypothetical protein